MLDGYTCQIRRPELIDQEHTEQKGGMLYSFISKEKKVKRCGEKTISETTIIRGTKLIDYQIQRRCACVMDARK